MLIKWKNIEERLDHKNVQEITAKYNLNHRKHRYKLVEEPKKQSKRVFIDKKLAIKVIMDCRKTSVHKFRTTLGFKQYDKIYQKNNLCYQK